MPSINPAGLALIKAFEGVRFEAYQDAGGTWTIGYGHTGPDVKPNEQINQAEADVLLTKDLNRFELVVNANVTRDLNPNQFSALVSFCYNVGQTAFIDSTLLRCVNRGDFEGAKSQFARWIHSGPQVLPGLIKRRAAEAALFALPV